MPPRDRRRRFGIDIRQRPDAAVVHRDVAARQAGIGKDIVHDRQQVFELLLGRHRRRRIALERNIGRADERALAKRQQKHRPAVAGFGIDALAREQLRQPRLKRDEVAPLRARPSVAATAPAAGPASDRPTRRWR